MKPFSRTSLWKALALFLLVPLFLFGKGSAQKEASSPALSQEKEILESLDQLEDEGLREEAAGNLPGAASIFRRTFQEALRESRRSPASLGEELQARAEFCLRKYANLVDRSSLYRQEISFIEGMKDPALPASLRALLHLYLSLFHFQTGNGEAGRREEAFLGCILDWHIIGPFNNEKGSGFLVAYPPEKEIDIAAIYEGKKVKAFWRRFSRRPPLGEIDLDVLFWPNDEAVAYALTYLHVEKGTPAVLRAASDEGLRIWLNGRLVLSREAKRLLSLYDQDAAPVWLQAGWNRLLVKVGELKGKWGFRLRVTDLEGAPLPNLTVDPSPGGKEPVQPELPPEESFSYSRGALDFFERAVKKGNDARHFFRLGYLYWSIAAHDENDHPDREVLQRACDLAPANPWFRYSLAQSMQRRVEMRAEKQENPRRKELERTLELNPGHFSACIDLATYYLETPGNRFKAEGFARRGLALNPRNPFPYLLLSRLADMKNWPQESARILLSLEEAELSCVPPLLHQAMAKKYAEEGDIKRALEHAEEAFSKARLNPEIRETFLKLLQERGELSRVLEECRDSLEIDPVNPQIFLRRAGIFEAQRKYGQAIEEVKKALAIRPQDPELLNHLGKRLHLNGEREEAMGVWKRALEINPNDVWLTQYMEFLQKEELPFEEAFNEEVKDIIAEASSIQEQGDPEAVLLDKMIARVTKDGTASRFVHRVVKILNDEGIRRNATFFESYAAGEQKLEFKKAAVIHPDGTREDARIFGRTVEPDGEQEIPTWSYKRVDFPPLDAGDVVEIQYKITDIKQSFFGDYYGESFTFQDWVPVHAAKFILITPKDKKFYFHYHKLDLAPAVVDSGEGETVTYIWEKRNIPKIISEPYMPPEDEVFPQLQVSTFQDWKSLGNWYWNLNRKQYEVNDEMREKVKSLTAGKKTELEKIQAIYNFVVQEIRYVAWEFGIHGFKPYNAATIFTRKHGDCKDKATLLIALLSLCGIEACPVIIDAQDFRGVEDYSLPMMEHFNHVLAYLPAREGREALFLDGTAQYSSVYDFPAMDTGATVLIVKEQESGLFTIPLFAPGENSRRERCRAILSEDGSASLSFQGEAKGEAASSIRFTFEVEGKRASDLEKQLSAIFPGARVVQAEFSDLKDLNIPVTYSYTLKVPNFIRTVPEGRSLENIPDPQFLGDLLRGAASLSEREFALVLPPPCASEVEVEVILPESLRVRSLPENVEIDEPFGTLLLRTRAEGQRVRVEKSLRIKTNRIPLEDYGEFRELCSRFILALEKKIIVEK